MIKKCIIIVLFALPVLAFVDITSNGAPPSSTGAPEEPNCTKSGCHQDFAVNSGPGAPNLTITGNPTSYTPGNTYTLTANITQSNLVRFGFQVVAIADRDSSNVGTFQVTEGSRTQIIPGFGSLSNRNYMTYTFAGSAALSTGLGQWTFNWTAPAMDVGPVTFYLAAIAANNDGTDMGDYGYTKSLKLSSLTSGIQAQTISRTEIFPNPVTENVTISCFLNNQGIFSIELFNIQGQKLEDLYSGNCSGGMFFKTFQMISYPEGCYFIRLTQGDKSVIKKLFVSPKK